MATTQDRPRPKKQQLAGNRILGGFDYLTLDPSPRLRKMREEHEKRTTDPATVIRDAWMQVGTAIAEAFRTIRDTASPSSR